VLLLHPDDIKLSGDVTKSFKPGKIGFWNVWREKTTTCPAWIEG
jgi:hypothetical protein